MPKRLAIAGLVVLASLSFPALGSSGASIEKPMAGSCSTVPVIEVSPLPGRLPLSLTGTCRLAHLGLAHVEASALIHPPVFQGLGSYTAPNGDRLEFSFGGEVASTGSGLSFLLTGSQTFTGGTGRFDGASGTVDLSGSAITQGSGIPGTGTLSIDGSIKY